MAVILKELLPVKVYWIEVFKPCIIAPATAAYVELQSSTHIDI